MAFAKTKYGKIYYEVNGSGEPVVLVRGLGRWSEHWNGFDKRLAEKFRVFKFDSRGVGRSTSPLLPWNSMKDLASDVALILKTERLESAHIIGTSLGGMIALQFAADYPEMAKSATAINASVGRSGHGRLSWHATKALINAVKDRKNLYPELCRVLLSSTTPSEKIDRMISEWQEVDKKYPLPIATVTKQLLIANRWRSVSAVGTKIKCPIHIILSDDDQFVPRGNSLFLAARLPNALLTRISEAGHEPHFDKPEALEKAIVGFIQQR